MLSPLPSLIEFSLFGREVLNRDANEFGWFIVCACTHLLNRWMSTGSGLMRLVSLSHNHRLMRSRRRRDDALGQSPKSFSFTLGFTFAFTPDLSELSVVHRLDSAWTIALNSANHLAGTSERNSASSSSTVGRGSRWIQLQSCCTAMTGLLARVKSSLVTGRP